MPAESEEFPQPGPLSLEELMRLVTRYLPVLRSYVRMNIGAALEAKESVSDIVQSTVRQICASREDVDWVNESAFKAWLHTCVSRKVFEKRAYWQRQKRDRSREQALDSGEDSVVLHSHTPSAIVIAGERFEQLQCAFEELDELERQLFSMAFIFSLPQVQIANELDMPESTVRGKILKLRIRLASLFDDGD